VVPTLIKQAKRKSWADVVSAAALDAVAQLGNEEDIPMLITNAAPVHSLRTRRAAASALGKMSDYPAARKRLIEMLEDKNPLLRTEVAQALGASAGERPRAALRSRLARETDGRVARRIREALLKADSGEEQRQTRERLLRLERELDDVKAQLASLKAKPKA
jgi:HEAT repeat protein